MSYNSFEDSDEYSHRLLNSIILHGKRAAYVSSIRPAPGSHAPPAKTLIGLMYLPFLRGSKQPTEVDAWVPATDPQLNWTDFRLGYCNEYPRHNDTFQAEYLTRRPARQYTQGLVSSVIFGSDRSQIDSQLLLYMKSFTDMLLGLYPSFKISVDKLIADGDPWDEKEKRVISMAFARRVALSLSTNTDTFYLQYRGYSVSSSDDPYYGFKLGKKYSHLAEVISTTGVKLRTA